MWFCICMEMGLVDSKDVCSYHQFRTMLDWLVLILMDAEIDNRLTTLH